MPVFAKKNIYLFPYFCARLQEVYRLNVTEFSQGNIMGLQTGAELTAKDTFYLGR